MSCIDSSWSVLQVVFKPLGHLQLYVVLSRLDRLRCHRVYNICIKTNKRCFLIGGKSHGIKILFSCEALVVICLVHHFLSSFVSLLGVD
jgi:hypothetical protein